MLELERHFIEQVCHGSYLIYFKNYYILTCHWEGLYIHAINVLWVIQCMHADLTSYKLITEFTKTDSVCTDNDQKHTIADSDKPDGKECKCTEDEAYTLRRLLVNVRNVNKFDDLQKINKIT